MSTVTENDLKRLEDLIIASRDENRTRFTALEAKFTGLEAGIATLETSLETRTSALQKELNELRTLVSRVEGGLQGQQPFIQKIPDLAEKVGELKNWRQIVIIALTALISSAITWGIRGGNLKP